MPTITIDPRFNGPPASGNGGYVSGVVAQQVEHAVEVQLRSPPELGRPLDVATDGDGGVTVTDGDTLVALARPTELVAPPPPRTVDLDEATEAATRFSGWEAHAFPTCWVCGPGRADGDGLRIFPGAVADGLVAAPWTPSPDVDAGDGSVSPEHVWAALDCPSYFGAADGTPSLLAAQWARLDAPVPVGEPSVVLGWETAAADGRKRHGAAAVCAPDGTVLARAGSLWIELRPEAAARLGGGPG